VTRPGTATKLALPAVARTQGFAIAAIILAAVATFANSVFNGFALDDNAIIAENPRVHQLENQAALWLTPYWPMFGRTLGLWRPLTIFGYAVQWSAGDGAPWVFHAVNIGLHALACVLVFLLLQALTSRAGALAGALLFAVHPLHTEVVANVVGQAELLAACSVLGAAALWAGRPGGRLEDGALPRYADPAIGRLRTLAVTAVFALGMLAKEGAIVLPPLLVALDLAHRRLRLDREGITRWLRAAAVPMLLLGAVLLAYFTVRVSVLGSIGGMDAAPNLPFLRDEGRVFSAFRAWPEYLRLLFFPFDLSADYSPGVILPATGFTPMIILGVVLLAGTTALALATPVRPRAGIAAAWFLIAVLPVSNLLLPIGVLLAERILYLPSVAIALVAGFAWSHAVRHSAALDSGDGSVAARGPAAVDSCDGLVATADPESGLPSRLGQRPLTPIQLARVFGAIVLVAFAARSFNRNPDWDSTETVWAALVEDHPESYRSQWVNGELANRAGQPELARDYWELAIRMWPDDPALLNVLAIQHLRLRNPERAVELLERSRALADYAPNTAVLSAYALLETGNSEAALVALDRADRLGAPAAPSLGLRAQAWQNLGRWNDAAGAWRFAIRQPGGDTFTFRMMLARALAYAGQQSEAAAVFDQARGRAPADTSLSRQLDQLDSAIRSGCLGVGLSAHGSAPSAGAASCPDPVRTWGVALPAAPQEVSNALQNATDRGDARRGDGD
jgi:tetratricopeptide (TPR) repeat protein